MSVVVDSSVTLAWFFDDERTNFTDSVLREIAESGACVPTLWRLEVANALQMAVRRHRIDAAYRDSTIAGLRSLPIVTDPDTDRHAWGSTLILAERCQLTLYDAAYLELAQRFALPLATLDQQLRKAAKSVKVALR